MYTLKEALYEMGTFLPHEGWNSQLLLMRSNAEITYSTNRTMGYLKCYTFTIIESGWMTMKYNGRHLFLQRGDMFVYSPGFAVKVLSVSDNYQSLILLADEDYTLSLPSVREAISTAYFSVVQLGEPVMHLSDDDFQGLQELILLGLRYQQSPSPRRNESLRLIYSLFLNELGGIEEHSIKEHRFPPRTEEIFLEFMHLLPLHFAEHHDIAFYADRLNITVSYLSRIVKTVSGGRTVIGYINQMLLMEASFLLSQTSLSIAQISDRLHFSEPAAFTRFFQHMRGMTPREFRKGK
jgi:AraC-like DNA-binding protein